MHCKADVGACTHHGVLAKLLTSSSGQPEAWAQCHEAKVRCPAEFCAFFEAGKSSCAYLHQDKSACCVAVRAFVSCFCKC